MTITRFTVCSAIVLTATWVTVAHGQGQEPGRFFQRNPVWSPSGWRVVFVSNRNGNIDLYSVNVHGSKRINLTSNPSMDVGASWSPDGDRIVSKDPAAKA